MTRIADDFPSINKRLAELTQDRSTPQFVVPDGIVLQMEDTLRRFPECDIALTVDSMRCRIVVSQLRRQRPDFLDYFLKCFPSAKFANNAIVMSTDDMRLLMQRMRVLGLR